MAIAIIEATLPGITGITGMLLNLYALDSDTLSVGSLVLVEATNRKCTYTTTTTAGLNGKFLVRITDSGVEQASGYVYMDDTANVHRVVSEAWMANIGGTKVDIGTSVIYLNSPVIPPVQTPDQVQATAFTFNELGQIEAGVKIYRQMIRASTNSGIYDDKIAEFISDINGIVVLTNNFQTAVYNLWRGSSAKFTWHVPVTTDLTVSLPPFFGRD